MSFWSKLFGRSASTAVPTPTPEAAFAAEVEGVLRAMSDVTDLAYDENSFSFSVTTGESVSTLYLENLFAERRDMNSEDRARRVRALVEAVQSGRDEELDWEDAQLLLVPLLRTATNFRQVPFEPEDIPYRRAFLPMLIECVGVDSENTIAYVGPRAVSDWQATESVLFDTARASLSEHVAAEDDVASFDSKAPYPIWYVSRDDSYESSRLLLPGWLASFADKVHGRPVAIVPERSTLVVGGDADERCLQRLIETAKRQYESSPRSISPALYTVDDAGHVVPLALAASHPLASEVALGHLMLAGSEYGVQKQILDEESDKDVFVAELTAIQREDGTYTSYAMWAEGVASLLPQAHEIAIMERPDNAEPNVFRAPWSVLLAAAADCLMQEPGMDPPRWRTVRWPDADVLRALQAARCDRSVP